MKEWWFPKSGSAKTVTALATLLILQIGLCFASPGEPAWFDRLFNIHPYAAEWHAGLVVLEAELCMITFLLLIVALFVMVSASWTSVDALSVVPRRSAGAIESAEPAATEDPV